MQYDLSQLVIHSSWWVHSPTNPSYWTLSNSSCRQCAISVVYTAPFLQSNPIRRSSPARLFYLWSKEQLVLLIIHHKY